MTDTQVTTKKVNRTEALASAFVLSAGLALFLSADKPQVVVLAAALLLLPLIASLWVMKVPIRRFALNKLEVYALPILPVLLYGAMLFFLHEIRLMLFAWAWVIADIPLFYLMFITQSALERYQSLPTHVGRVVLNILSLFTGYMGYSFLFNQGFPIWLLMGLVFGFTALIGLQAMLWWNSGNVRYSLFYAAFTAFWQSVLALLLCLWPVGHFVLGVIMLIGLYLLMGLIQNYFKKTLTRYVVIEHLVVTMMMLIFILSQVVWIPHFD